MSAILHIKKIDPVPPSIEYIDLRLTGDEADMLYDVLCVIGGTPERTRRGHAASLFATLREAYPGRNCQRPVDLDGRLYFQLGGK